jgi:Glycosyl hydrolases family 2, sugar binding domain/Glycosyl hydrolases family 2
MPDIASLVARVSIVLSVIATFPTALEAEPVRLDAGWELITDPGATLQVASLPAAGWRSARVGVSWNAQFADLRDYVGVAWYRTRFTVAPSKAAERVLLRFGAVDYHAEVFVNGEAAGSHEGAYTPFTLDVTKRVKPGPNALVVRVTDPPAAGRGRDPRFPQFNYDELPRGKQNWYIQNGGVWQPVWLDVRPALYIDAVRVSSKVSGAIDVDADIVGTAPTRAVTLKVDVRDAQGAVVASLPAARVTGPGVTRVTGTVPAPKLWSPASPTLYTVEASLAGEVSDGVTDRFGFREFVARDGRFFLNGEPFYMIGALDQDFYPDTIYSTPGKAYLVDMMQKGRRLGLNVLRCHIKVCDPDYLAAADEVGMLVWYEVPSWERWTPASVERGKAIFEAMTTRDWNRPSIVIQTLINEAWGIDMKQADERAGLLKWFEESRPKLQPLGRLLVDNSPCCENYHLKTDIDDYHQYYSIPDNADRWDKWVADFASRPAWSFSAYGDAVRTRQEPLVVSEFGNWGLPELPAELPWWFARDFDGRAITRPAGLFDRFHGLGFDRVFQDYPTLARETQWRQFYSLKHEIESMRRHASIQGYVITEFTDINWEANGLMDMWRRPKIYAERLAAIQQEDVLLPSTPQRNYTTGDDIEIAVLMSRYSVREAHGGSIRWTTTSGQKGELPVVQAVTRGAVETLTEVNYTAPKVVRASLEQVTLELTAGDGSILARNTHDVFVYPAASAVPEGAVLHDPNALLGHLPWKAGALTPGATVVASVFDAEVRAHVEAGGTAVVAASKVLFGVVEAPGLSIVERRAELDGNWVTNFTWLHTASPLFAGLGLTRITGFEAAAATPRTLIDGVATDAWRQGDVLSGVFYGWLNQNHATTVQYKAGKGKVVFTTFDTASYGKDPFVTHLVHRLVEYVRSDKCAPASELARR